MKRVLRRLRGTGGRTPEQNKGLLTRVKENGRVNVLVPSEKCSVDAMVNAKKELQGNMEGENLLELHAGLNDLLKKGDRSSEDTWRLMYGS